MGYGSQDSEQRVDVAAPINTVDNRAARNPVVDALQGTGLEDLLNAADDAVPTNCEWMFGDVAMGWLGVHHLAHLNPLRWSGPVSFDKAIQDLEDVRRHDNRPILIKIPAYSLEMKQFPDIDSTLEHIRQLSTPAGIKL